MRSPGPAATLLRLASAAAALLLALPAALPPAPAPEACAIVLLDDVDGERGPTCQDWVAVLPPGPPIPAVCFLSVPLRRDAVCSVELPASDRAIPSRAPPRV